MEQAGDIIKDALSEITVYGAEAPLEAADTQLAIRYLNRMMGALDANGIDLGYTQVGSTADEVTVPDGAIDGVVTNLAFNLWRHFADDAPIPQDLAMRARDGLKTMRMIAVNVGATEFGETLPTGSGNNADYAGAWNRFYPALQATILAETNGSISLEDDTNE